MALNNFNTNTIHKQDWQAKKAKKVHTNSKKKTNKNDNTKRCKI